MNVFSLTKAPNHPESSPPPTQACAATGEKQLPSQSFTTFREAAIAGGAAESRITANHGLGEVDFAKQRVCTPVSILAA